MHTTILPLSTQLENLALLHLKERPHVLLTTVKDSFSDDENILTAI